MDSKVFVCAWYLSDLPPGGISHKVILLFGARAQIETHT